MADEQAPQPIVPPSNAANGAAPSSTGPAESTEVPAKKSGPRWTPPDPNGTSEHSRLSRERWAQAKAMGLDHPPPIPKHLQQQMGQPGQRAPQPDFPPPIRGHHPHPPYLPPPPPHFGFAGPPNAYPPPYFPPPAQFGFAGPPNAYSPPPYPYPYGAYPPGPAFNTPGYVPDYPPYPPHPAFSTPGYVPNYPPYPPARFPTPPLPAPPLPFGPSGSAVGANYLPPGAEYDAPGKIKKKKKPMMSPDEQPSETKLLVKKLPLDVTPREISKFFWPDRCTEIKLGVDRLGRQNGDAIVQFETTEVATKVLGRTRGSIRGQQLRLFPTTQAASRLRRIQWKTD